MSAISGHGGHGGHGDRTGSRFVLRLALLAALLALVSAPWWWPAPVDARPTASAHLVGTGVDPHGYWFARVEIARDGAVSWRSVDASATLMGEEHIDLEVGSTLPQGDVPERFDVVFEGVRQAEVPTASRLDVVLGVIVARPWPSSGSPVATLRFAVDLAPRAIAHEEPPR
jgi:hypothetical protein